MILAERRILMALFNKLKGATTLFVGFSALFISINTWAGTSTSTEFSATIAYEGACEIEVSKPTISFNNGEAVLPSEIEANAAAANETFNLILSGCKGAGLTPKITIAGESNSDTGKMLFLDTANSTTTGYGILLKTIGTSVFKANDNLALVKTLSVNDDWDVYTHLSTINGSIPMTATLNCGNCEMDGRLGGELKASVTFNFEYE